MEKRWLSLREAAKYASIGEHRLLRLVGEGALKGCQDKTTKTRAWIFDRLSIDQYYERQMSMAGIHEKALAIVRTLRV